MDTLSHALYGATLFSRTGLAGGRRGSVDAAGRKLRFDWTTWAAGGFGLLPDAASLGVYILYLAVHGRVFNFYGIPPGIFTAYHALHSLLIAGLMVWLLRLLWRPIFVPALAWPLHIAMDTFMHGRGVFQTPLFYPVLGGTTPGINWWEHPWVSLTAWSILPALWLALFLWRRSSR